MSERGIRELVYGFCQALTLKNLDEISELFSDDASLSWGPYDFVGKESILTWVTEFFKLFPFIAIKEKQLQVFDSTAKHEFMIGFLTAQGRKGGLPCEGIYTIKDGKIHQINVKVLYGFLSVSRDEVG